MDNRERSGFQHSTAPIIRKLIENIESPYVWMPLGLFVLCVLAYPLTSFVGFIYLAVAFTLLAFGADWIGRIRNRKPPELPNLDSESVRLQVDRYFERVLSQSNTLREQGKMSAANALTANARGAIFGELTRLADEYTRKRESQSPGWERTREMGALVQEMRDVARRAAVEALQPDEFLESPQAGARILGLAILEELNEPSHFEQVLERISNSSSAFEQYHALRVVEAMFPRLGSDQREQLKDALQDQMSGGDNKWITPETDRWPIASRILDAIQTM